MFARFCEIENSERIKIVDSIIDQGFDKDTWEVTVKIDGSNLGFYINPDMTTYFASRNRILSDSDNHYNHKEVFAKLNPDVKSIREKTKLVAESVFNEKSTVVVYGEIFGGSYPHPDITRTKEAIRVQKGIFYCPSNDFLAFDVAVINLKTEEEKNEIRNRLETARETNRSPEYIKQLEAEIDQPNMHYLTPSEIDFVLESSGINRVPSLGTFSFKEALDINPVFESVVYKLYNLPKIENNMEEGIVIRPTNGGTLRNGDRVILKIKNPRFGEKNGRSEIKVEENTNLSPITVELIEESSKYINENRLQSVMSKLVGPFSSKSFGLILKEFTLDTIKDFEKDCSEKIQQSKENNEYKHVTKSISKLCTEVIRKNFVNIIDGIF